MRFFLIWKVSKIFIRVIKLYQMNGIVYTLQGWLMWTLYGINNSWSTHCSLALYTLTNVWDIYRDVLTGYITIPVTLHYPRWNGHCSKYMPMCIDIADMMAQYHFYAENFAAFVDTLDKTTMNLFGYYLIVKYIRFELSSHSRVTKRR